MKKEQLVKRLAKESNITPGAAADQVDRILRDILMRIRKGQSAALPGLGTFRPGTLADFQFEVAPPAGQHSKSKKESK